MLTILVSCILALVVYDNYNKNNLMKDKIQSMEFELAMIRYSVIHNRTTSLSLLPPVAQTLVLPSAPDYDPTIE